MKINFVGLGGIGSALIQPIAKYLSYYTEIKELSVYMIDPDKVEENNLSRQAFIIGDINQFKAEIMKQEFLSKFGDLNRIKTVESIKQALSFDNGEEFITEDSVTLCAVDNYVTRVMIEEMLVSRKNAICIYGTNNYHDGDVQIVWIRNGHLVFKRYTERHPELIKNPKGKHPDDKSCADETPSAPQLIMANKMAAQIMCNAFYSFLMNKLSWYATYFDCEQGDVRVERDMELWQTQNIVGNVQTGTVIGQNQESSLPATTVG